MTNLIKSFIRLLFGIGEVKASPKLEEIVYSVDRERAILKLAIKSFEGKKRLKV